MSLFSEYAKEIGELLQATQGQVNTKDLPIDDVMNAWIEKTRELAVSGKKIFFIGNGASATMAEHLGFDAMQNGKLKTINFAETSYITAVSNDLSYEEVFLLKLESLAEPGDMLVSISSSGNSPNVVAALGYARQNGMFTATLSAMKPNNKSRQLGDISIYVPADTYGVAESVHSAIMHSWLDLYMEKYLGGRH